MKKSKALLLALCAAALSVGVTFGTLAYLTDSEAVTNTFTVGQVHISLDELDTDGSKTNVTPDSDPVRDKANEYHLIPGQTYTKDPIVHVRADSESSWVFVKVENGISNIECDDAGYVSVAAQVANNGWTSLDGATNVFYKSWEKGAADCDLEVFEGFKVDGAVTNDQIATYANSQIVVTAYAIQAAGFESDVSGAWGAFVAQNPELFG